MPTILRIDRVFEWQDASGKTHYRTYATMTDGDELAGYGKDYQVGDKVERFYHREVGKMRKSRPPKAL